MCIRGVCCRLAAFSVFRKNLGFYRKSTPFINIIANTLDDLRNLIPSAPMSHLATVSSPAPSPKKFLNRENLRYFATGLPFGLGFGWFLSAYAEEIVAFVKSVLP